MLSSSASASIQGYGVVAPSVHLSAGSLLCVERHFEKQVLSTVSSSSVIEASLSVIISLGMLTSSDFQSSDILDSRARAVSPGW